MTLNEWIHDLPHRLETCADQIDDLANSDWVTRDEDRDRLFALEAQIWRIAQTARKRAVTEATLLPLLDRGLQAARSNLGLCLRQPVCEDEGMELLDPVALDLFELHRKLEMLLRRGKSADGAVTRAGDWS